jgi:predicted O-methyltransferase YrrM
MPMSPHQSSPRASRPLRTARRLVRRGASLAFDQAIKRAPIEPGRLLRLDFPTSGEPTSRYGYGKPPHARLARLLASHDADYERVLRDLGAYREELLAIPLASGSLREPRWHNQFLFGIDGATLYAFTRSREPKLYVEVGSGNSTLFVDRARRDGALQTRIVSIDPHPRRQIDEICDRVVREPLEQAGLELISELQAGDMLFMDGTHRVFTNSDATVFFLDVLPELAPGVLVGIHDIHLPDDYRPEHARRYYSEQYLLAAYLLAEPDWLRPVLPCWYVSGEGELGELARALIPPQQVRTRGVIFWLEIAGDQGAGGSR